MQKYDLNRQKRWTCGSIESETASANNNSSSVGALEDKIMEIIGQNITQRHIT